MIVINDDPVDFFGVVVVVPGSHNLFGAHELQSIGKVMGRHRFPVGPARQRIQLKIHGLLIFAVSPVRCQLRQDVHGIGMQSNQGKLIPENSASEGRV